MAEAAVNIVIERLVPFLIEEGRLVRKVKTQIQEIGGQLQLIKAYIRDADEKAERGGEGGELAKAWVKQVREAAYRIEDVMDEYKYHEGSHSHRCGPVGVLCDFLKTLKPRHDIAHEIEAIKGSIETLHQTREKLEFNVLPAEPSDGGTSSSASRSRPKSNLRLGAHLRDDSQLVGVDSTKQRLMDWLSSEESRRTVIGVVGEGGLGKTTIVKNIYEKQKEKRSFDFYDWITVSHSLKDEKLLQAIRCFHKEDNKKEETRDKETLINEVKEYLQERRYMIVFDDVWDIEFWKAVEFALPDNHKGSRIMMTTRNKDVADFCNRFAPVHIHPLDPLPFQDALMLFHRKAFPFDPQGCPQELIGLSRDFVKKCKGVPLAIEAIAGLLSTKRKNASEWKMVHDSLHSRMASDDPHLSDYHQVLSESYYDLPYNLKLCLLYFGVFPEDYSVSCGRLARLWIAEGFVKKKVNEDQTLEEVAREYLNELIRRNLVKALEVHVDDRVRECQVHDLLHNFILKKCEEISFCQVKKSEEFEFYNWTRRLSIHDHVQAKQKSNNVSGKGGANYGRVRCCFLFNMGRMPMTIAELLSFKMLIVLDFENAHLDFLPKAVENLLHLKYLSLKETYIKVLPKFIGKLQNLETLDLRSTNIVKLPVETNKLVKLRYLVIGGLQLKRGIGALGTLQKLSSVDVRDSDGVIKELKNLTKMRNLGITNLKEHQGKLLCKSIESMNHLYALYVKAIDDNEVVDLQSLDDPPQYLQRLSLGGRLGRVPEWIPRLQNLVRLQLRYSALKEDPISFIQDLPELLELELVGAYEGDELHFRSGWFKKLKALELGWMRGLKTLRIDKGALPSLERMTLVECALVEVPTHINSLETLKLFHLMHMPQQFIDSLWQKEGQSYDKIKAITRVFPLKKEDTC